LKERVQTQRTLRRGMAFRTKGIPLLKFLFFRRFFSLDKEKKRQKKNSKEAQIKK
jgi:hypothetical protein